MDTITESHLVNINLLRPIMILFILLVTFEAAVCTGVSGKCPVRSQFALFSIANQHFLKKIINTIFTLTLQ